MGFSEDCLRDDLEDAHAALEERERRIASLNDRCKGYKEKMATLNDIRSKLEADNEKLRGELADAKRTRETYARGVTAGLDAHYQAEIKCAAEVCEQLQSDLARERERAEACALELCRANDILGDSEWPELRRSLDATQAALERAEGRLAGAQVLVLRAARRDDCLCRGSVQCLRCFARDLAERHGIDETHYVALLAAASQAQTNDHED